MQWDQVPLASGKEIAGLGPSGGGIGDQRECCPVGIVTCRPSRIQGPLPTSIPSALLIVPFDAPEGIAYVSTTSGRSTPSEARVAATSPGTSSNPIAGAMAMLAVRATASYSAINRPTNGPSPA